MRRWQEIGALIVTDLLGTVIAFGFAVWVRAGRPAPMRFPLEIGEWIEPALLIGVLWLALWGFVGLYGDWIFKSRIEEIVLLAKAATFGGALLFVLTFDSSNPMPESRVVLLSYWFMLILVCGAGRFNLRGVQRNLLRKGRGRRRAVIVGTGSRAHHLVEDLRRYPVLGHDIVGLLGEENPQDAGGGDIVPVLGSADELPRIVAEKSIVEVMFTDPALTHDDVLELVVRCNGIGLTFYTVPDLYDVIVGRRGLSQIFGTPLMPLFPDYMPVWERRVKRILDVAISILVLIVGAPVWLAIAVAIRLDSRGPAIFSQERVGRAGANFKVHKFRSMVSDAEKKTGPVWAKENDPRITRLGQFIRRTRLDEVPQFWNIFKGEMSLVGPRPERPFFVEKLASEIPMYRWRTKVKPGLTGWAQTKMAYDANLDDVREKLTYDLYYIENMSLKFDMIIMLRTVGVVLTGKGAR